MGLWDKIKDAAAKVADAVKNVVVKAVEVIKTVPTVSSTLGIPATSTVEAVAKIVKTISTSTKTIQDTDDIEVVEEAKDNILKAVDDIRSVVTPPPELAWWEKVLKTIADIALFPFTVSSAIIDRIMFEVTGEHNTENVWAERGYEAISFLTPLDELSKLFFNENLAGQPAEFIPSEDTFNLIVDSLFFLPVGKIGKVGLKLGEKVGALGVMEVAGKLGLKKASPEVIEALLKSGNYKYVFEAARIDPASWAKLMPKLSTAAKSIILKGLSKQADKTAYKLASKALVEYAQKAGMTTLEKVIGVLPGKTAAQKGVIAITTLLGTVAGYITLAQFLAWTGKEAVKEAVSFSGLYLFIDNQEWQSAKDHLPALKTAIEAYDKSTTLAKVIPFIGTIWKEAIKNAWAEYYYYEKLIDAELAKVTLETEEEKWERIRAEQEAREEADRIAEAEYYVRIQEEADKRKAAARIEEAEYYEKIRIEAEERAAARKIEEAEYWANIQEQARITEEEGKIAAEEYWAKVAEEQRLKREEERLYWEARLAGPKKATITITSEPTNSDVYIDGEYTFTKTPYTTLLVAGKYIVMVQAEGYYPQTLEIEVEESEVGEVPFTLEAIPTEEIPTEPYIPYQPVYAPGYEKLYPATISIPSYQAPAPVPEKELLLNIETTDLYPWKGRIYSIAIQDLSIPNSAPIVLIDDDEEKLILQFLDLFNQLNPKKLIGFKLTFDHRFIFAKMMLYRIQNKAFKEIQMRDIKQIMDQVKEEFVYFPSKVGTLDNWGKMLLGIGKLGSQELMLRKYLAGDFDYVKAFQERQMEITNGIYQLSRFVGSESLLSPISGTAEAFVTETLLPAALSSQTPGQKQCKNCLAFNQLEAKGCYVCGQEF